MTMRLLVPCLMACAGPALAEAQTVPAPTHTEGDTWVFDQTQQKGQTGFARARLVATVDRVEGETILVGIKADGAPNNPVDKLFGQDWSQRRLVDGAQTTTTRPFKFPLSIGKSWSIDYQDNSRRGNQLNDHVRRTYKVVGWEDVTVPAGTFHTLKVEAKGVDEGLIEVPAVAASGAAAGSLGGASFSAARRGGRGTLTRVMYAAMYYLPAAGTYVKSVEEQYTPDNVLVSRNTLELVSYRVK